MDGLFKGHAIAEALIKNFGGKPGMMLKYTFTPKCESSILKVFHPGGISANNHTTIN